MAFFLCIILNIPAAHAQDDSWFEIETITSRDTSLEQRLEKAKPAFEGKNFITLAIENDSIGGGTDQYYTSGVRASWFQFGSDLPPAIDELADHIPGFDVDDKTSIFFSLGQNLYTPNDITIRDNQDSDRPWAAWLYGSLGLASITDNHVDEFEASLGVVGPPALGKQAQRFVHKAINSPKPRGWENQLKTEPGLILSWERRYPAALSIESSNLWFDISPSYGITLGNVYTHANAGLSFQIGPEIQRWQDMPVRVRPSMPGTGFFAPVESKTRLGWIIFGGADMRAVGRNIFLDGNTFRDSHSVDKKPFVFDLNAGAALTYGPVRTSYTIVRRSKEFDGQEKASYFGGLTITMQF